MSWLNRTECPGFRGRAVDEMSWAKTVPSGWVAGATEYSSIVRVLKIIGRQKAVIRHSF